MRTKDMNPVAWLATNTQRGGIARLFFQHSEAVQFGDDVVPLYAEREWVGLTEDDMPAGDNPVFDSNEFILGMAWAQAKLKEKNT